MRRGFFSSPCKIIAAMTLITMLVLLLSSMHLYATSSDVIVASEVVPMGLPSPTAEPSQSSAESPAVAHVLQIVEPEPVEEPEVYYDEVTDPDFNGYAYVWEPLDEIPLTEDLQQCVFDVCELYGVDRALILGMIECESTFEPEARSGQCWGLMQIHSINYSWLLEDEGIDATTYSGNIEAGTLMISQLIDKYGDVHLALMAYNCGETGARGLWNQGVYSTNYSWAVTRASEKWAVVLGNPA